MSELSVPHYCSGAAKYTAFFEYARTLDDSGDESGDKDPNLSLFTQPYAPEGLASSPQTSPPLDHEDLDYAHHQDLLNHAHHVPYEEGDEVGLFYLDNHTPSQPPPLFRPSELYNLGSTIASLILSICTAANQKVFLLNKEDRSRLQFLKDTVTLITDYVSHQDESVRKFEPCETLLSLITTRMNEVHEVLEKILSQSSAMTENFDIFELKLRSHLEELKSMFPIGGSPVVESPSLLIADPAARKAWEKSFGLHTHIVSFSSFVFMLQKEGLLSSLSEQDRERFVLFLRYFVNFPSDDAITTYKWAQLIRLFGPYDSFAKTFGEVVARRGFLGLINRIKAYEILTMIHQPRSLLIRMSRTEPQFLAFSYKNSSGQIGHQINKDKKTGLPIPVGKFIRTKFSGYTLVNKTVDVNLILGKNPSGSLCEYATTPTGYIL